MLLSGWLVALLVGVSRGPDLGMGLGQVHRPVRRRRGLAVAWILVELRAATPLIDMRMMRSPAVWTNNLVALLFGVGMYSTMAFLPEFLQTPKAAGYGFGASIIQSGLYSCCPLTVTMFILGLFVRPARGRAGLQAAVITGSSSSSRRFLAAFALHTQVWEIYRASGVVGVGFGLAFSAMSNLIVPPYPRRRPASPAG